MLSGIAIVGPTETGEGKCAVETRIAVHEGIVGLVFYRRSLQLGVGVQSGRQLAVGHGEHLDKHQTCTVAVTTRIVGTDITLPGVIFGSIIDTCQNDCRIILREEDGLRTLHLGEYAGKVAAIDIIIGRIETIATGVDVVQVFLHFCISASPAALIVGAVEQRAGPKQQQTAFQGQGRTCCNTAIVLV